MKNTAFIFLFILAWNSNLVSQTTSFSKTYTIPGIGLSGVKSLIQTSDKGFVFISEENQNNSILTKTDSIGNIIWSSSWQHVLRDLLEDDDSGIVVVGTNKMAKINPSGTIIWSKYYGQCDFKTIQKDVDNGFTLSGTTYQSILFYKTDQNGDLIWKKAFSTLGNGFAHKHIQIPHDSSYIVIGTDYQSGVVTLRISYSGNLIWSKEITPFPYYGASATDIIVKDTNRFLIAFYSPTGIVEIDTSGAVGNSIKFPQTFESKLFQTADHSLFLCKTGFNYDNPTSDTWDVILTKLDSNLTPIWSKNIGGKKYDQLFDVVPTSDQGIAIATTTSNFTLTPKAIMLIKDDSLLNLSCKQTLFTIPYNSQLVNSIPYPVSISIPYTFSMPSPPVTSPIGLNTEDVCICVPPTALFSHLPGANYVYDHSTWGDTWLWDFGNGTYDSINVTPDIPLAYQYISGNYFLCLTVSNACGTSTFCDSIDYVFQSVGLSNEKQTGKITAYPNPILNTLKIENNSNNSVLLVEIIDIHGKIIKEIQMERELSLELSNINAGVYTLKLSSTTKDFIEYKKIVKIN